MGLPAKFAGVASTCKFSTVWLPSGKVIEIGSWRSSFQVSGTSRENLPLPERLVEPPKSKNRSGSA